MQTKNINLLTKCLNQLWHQEARSIITAGPLNKHSFPTGPLKIQVKIINMPITIVSGNTLQLESLKNGIGHVWRLMLKDVHYASMYKVNKGKSLNVFAKKLVKILSLLLTIIIIHSNFILKHIENCVWYLLSKAWSWTVDVDQLVVYMPSIKN